MNFGMERMTGCPKIKLSKEREGVSRATYNIFCHKYRELTTMPPKPLSNSIETDTLPLLCEISQINQSSI